MKPGSSQSSPSFDFSFFSAMAGTLYFMRNVRSCETFASRSQRQMSWQQSSPKKRHRSITNQPTDERTDQRTQPLINFFRRDWNSEFARKVSQFSDPAFQRFLRWLDHKIIGARKKCQLFLLSGLPFHLSSNEKLKLYLQLSLRLSLHVIPKGEKHFLLRSEDLAGS